MARKITGLDRRLVTSTSLWSYLPWLLLYPLRLAPLFGVLLLGSGLWFFSVSIAGLFFLVSFTTGLLQYCLTVLEKSAVGRGDPPTLGSDELLYWDSRLGRLLLAVLLFAAMVRGAGELSPAAGWSLNLLGWLVLPAFTLLVTLSDSLRHSLSPQRLLRVALLSGPAYPLLAAAMAAAWTLGLAPQLDASNPAWQVQSLLSNPPGLDRWLLIMAAGSGSILFAHLLGFIAYHHREALGLMVEVDETDIAREDGVDDATVRRRLLEQLDGLLRAGEEANALAALRHAARGLGHEEQLELLDDLATHDFWPLVRDQGQRCMEAQLEAKHGELAVITALRMLHHFSTFQPRTATSWRDLCRAASQHRPRDGFELLATRGFEHFPDAPERVDVALLLANHYSEIEKDDDRAASVLEKVCDVTDHPRHRQVTGLLKLFRPA